MRVDVEIGGVVIEGWNSYSISCDMLSIADDFNVTIGGSPAEIREWYTVARPDEPVKIYMDDIVLLSGFIDDRMARGDAQSGTVLTATGRDKGGRLVDESMDLVTFGGMTLLGLASLCADPWFPLVTLSNAPNRDLLRSKAKRRAKTRTEPVAANGSMFGFTAEEIALMRTEIGDVIPAAQGGGVGRVATPPKPLKAAKKVEPGESRWDVLHKFLIEAEQLAWSTANGEFLFIGLPNYDQESQYRFRVPATPEPMGNENLVLDWTVTDSVGERYSRITAMGASKGDARNYGKRVTRNRYTVDDGPGEYGTGEDFVHRKILYISDDDIRNAKLAETRALKEKNERDSTGHQIEMTLQGHVDFETNALFMHDNVADVSIEPIDLHGRYMLVSAEFMADGTGGKTTSIRMVPEGTKLSL